VVEKLSEGSIAALYRAEHVSLGRKAVVKTLKSTLARGSTLGEGLLREARILGKLAHPSIVRLYDLEQSDGAAWIALEEVRGAPLAELIARSPQKRLAPEEATAIALGIAEALEHAHNNGVVHRDLRPSCLVIAASGRPVIVDFGAAVDNNAPAS